MMDLNEMTEKPLLTKICNKRTFTVTKEDLEEPESKGKYNFDVVFEVDKHFIGKQD